MKLSVIRQARTEVDRASVVQGPSFGGFEYTVGGLVSGREGKVLREQCDRVPLLYTRRSMFVHPAMLANFPPPATAPSFPAVPLGARGFFSGPSVLSSNWAFWDAHRILGAGGHLPRVPRTLIVGVETEIGVVPNNSLYSLIQDIYVDLIKPRNVMVLVIFNNVGANAGFVSLLPLGTYDFAVYDTEPFVWSQIRPVTYPPSLWLGGEVLQIVLKSDSQMISNPGLGSGGLPWLNYTTVQNQDRNQFTGEYDPFGNVGPATVVISEIGPSTRRLCATYRAPAEADIAALAAAAERFHDKKVRLVFVQQTTNDQPSLPTNLAGELAVRSPYIRCLIRETRDEMFDEIKAQVEQFWPG